ncbi:hypothetical protein M422DRAFT_262812 [Sphaerobolus stellatus SS14]|uniref:Uncharacterized protein n=1 Tax=Sphaerobolus stellatus (strain SS14) TaxID=990650 RepID=A0A0C9UJK9_SPHS4|nr:hypothetical protein M422DRAFT_262812 [Sphaerobolus stellatus SS14]
MDNEPNAHMQVDLSTTTMSAIQAFKTDSSTPVFIAIKHKMGCPICDASALHCMAVKRSYEIRLAEKDISHAVTDAWPELVRYQDDYYRLLEDYNVLKESIRSAKAKAEECRAKMTQTYNKLDSRQVTIQNLGDQLNYPPARTSSSKTSTSSRSLNTTLGGHPAWADRNGYRITDIPTSDEEDDDEDLAGLPTIPEDIPQNIPLIPPTKHAHPVSKTIQNDSKVIHEAGIPAIGGSRLPPKQKRIVADPPTSIMGILPILPKPLGKARAERWDQPALRGASEWIMEHDIHDSEMRRLYIKGKALPPHERSPDHTAAMFHIDEYARSLPGLPRNLVTHHNDPDWMTEVIQNFNANPSGVPRNL